MNINVLLFNLIVVVIVMIMTATACLLQAQPTTPYFPSSNPPGTTSPLPGTTYPPGYTTEYPPPNPGTTYPPPAPGTTYPPPAPGTTYSPPAPGTTFPPGTSQNPCPYPTSYHPNPYPTSYHPNPYPTSYHPCPTSQYPPGPTSQYPPGSTTTTLPPPWFSLKCSMSDAGPVLNPNIPPHQQMPFRGPGYGHKAINRTTDVLVIASNKLPEGAPTPAAGFSGSRQVNTYVVAINASDCSFLWTYQANSSIVVAPMFDSSSCVVQTYDVETMAASIISLDVYTGKPRYAPITTNNIARVNNFGSAIHDGRIYSYYVNNDTKYPNQFGFVFQSYDAKTGRPDFGWNQCCIDIPSDPATGLPNPSVFQHELYLGFDVEASWGFIGYGNTVVGFEGVTGMREWEVSLKDVVVGPGTNNTDQGNWQCSSASANMGFLSEDLEKELAKTQHKLKSKSHQGGEKNKGSGSILRALHHKNVKFHSSIGNNQKNKKHSAVEWTKKPLNVFLTCHNIYSSQHSRKHIILALHQRNGTFAYRTMGVESNFVSFAGPVTLSKYSTTGCFLANTAINCFDTVSGNRQVYTDASRFTFRSLPVVGYTDPTNYVLAASVDSASLRTLVVSGFNPQAPVGPFPSETSFKQSFSFPDMQDDLFAFGYPESFEDGYHVGVVGVGMKDTGVFAILESTN